LPFKFISLLIVYSTDMVELYGYNGKALSVNLSTGKMQVMELSEGMYRKLLGGKGLGVWYLYDLVGPTVDPLSPNNALIMSVGPMTGTHIPLASRYNVNFKSPLTGIYGVSQSAGYFPHYFKHSGFDVVIFMGRAERPVYLWIDDGKAEIRKADHIWGKDTFETDEIIKEELGDKRRVYVASIGQAGENLVKYASIQNDRWHSAGRAGAGAVMGSKRLKAIAVRGAKPLQVYNFDEFREFLRSLSTELKTNPATRTYHDYGTPALVDLAQRLGVFPTRYWHKSTYEKYYEINSTALQTKIFVKNWSCYNCPVACGRYVRLKRREPGLETVGPEYETIYSFGSLCEIDDLEAIALASDLCDRYGMDTISAGNSIAFAMDAYEMGKLKSDRPIRFGDAEVMLELVEKIAFRKGIGDLLAEGAREMEKRLGLKGHAVHMKGLEPAGYELRGLKGTALAFSVASRGACHMRASFYDFELKGQIDRFTMDLHKVDLLKDREDWIAVMDSMVLCRFSRAVFPWESLTKGINLITGFNLTDREVKKAGERIVNLSRLFNVGAGVRREDDYPAKRFMVEPLRHGPSKGHVIDRGAYERMLDRYYEVRGWNKDGIPTKNKLRELEILD
jgi:aldehyde:ferredoxin oxidoreductase